MPMVRLRKRFAEIFVKRADTNRTPTTNTRAAMLNITLNTSILEVTSAITAVSPNVNKKSNM